jgi:hypothetical protein
MKKQLDLTPQQERECFKMREFFPGIARGHGSQHRNIMGVNAVEFAAFGAAPASVVGHRCNAKACDGFRNHGQVRDVAAAEYIIARDT